MNRRDQEINEILVELAVISEKIDNIKEDLQEIKELEDRLQHVEKQQSYAKGIIEDTVIKELKKMAYRVVKEMKDKGELR